MKRQTLHKRTRLANDIMYYIYTHIDTEINLDTLAQELEISKFYMHKLFKEIFGKNIYETIKSIRLQKAANLLLTNPHATISEIGNACGYSSHSSFIRAFRTRFDMSPKEWKRGGYNNYTQQIINDANHPARFSTATFCDLTPQIVKMPPIQSYYIRHKGYNRSMQQTWQKLYTWVLEHELSRYRQIGLYHDNPAITPHHACHYIACIALDEEEKQRISHSHLPSFTISGGVYAKFDLEGVYGDILQLIRWIYHVWLPKSGYETTTRPAYAIHHKNHFLREDGRFSISFYVSVRY